MLFRRDHSASPSPSSTKSPGPRRALVVAVGLTALAIGVALIANPARAGTIVLVAVAVIAIELVWAVRRSRVTASTVPPRSVPGVTASWGPIIIGLVVVVASFSGALVFSQFRIVGTEARAKGILSNTIPSITHLSAARTALRELGTLIDGFLLEPSRVTTLRRDLTAARARLDASLASYAILPRIPQDLEPVAEIAREIALADQAIERVLAGTGGPPGGQLAIRTELHARLARADEAVRRLVLLNNSFAETSAEAVIEHRRESAVAAGLFGAISIVVAGLAGFLAIGRMRARARLIDERDRLLAARATELEVFAGRVAHDLRSPLASVALRAAALQDRHQRDPQLRDDLGKLIRQTERMAEIIDDLLAFASAGARPRPDSSAELHKIVDEVVADFRPVAEAMRAELRVAELPAIQVACTPAALTCALSNLVGNAVKYLGEGRHAVAWVAVRVLDHGGVARIEVEDTGPGLPPDAEQRVFEPFQRLSGLKPGIGLGLATVKKIVEAYGGRVGVRSSLGKGSTFWFELPVAPAPAPSASLPGRDGDQPGSS
jgi:signal transduction histidine kinase